MQSAKCKHCILNEPTTPVPQCLRLHVDFCILHYAISQLVLGVRPAPPTTSGSARTRAAAAATAAGVRRRYGERDELRARCRGAARTDDDKLTAVVHVGHRQADLR